MSLFIKGKFRGVYKKIQSNHVGNYIHSDFDWKYIEIKDCEKLEGFDAEVHKTHNFRFYKKISTHRLWGIGKKTEIFISIGDNQYYSDAIYNVLLKNFKLNKDETSLLGSEWREVMGDVYFQIESKKKVKDSQLKAEVFNISVNQNQVITEKKNIIVSGFNNFTEHSSKDSVLFGSKNSSVGDLYLPISKSNGRWSKWISRILCSILFLLILIYLLNSARLFFYILAGIGLLWLISRVVNLGNIFRFTASLLLFGFIGYFILKLFYETSTGINPVKKREGNIKITPTKEIDTNGDGKIDDEISDKEINWYDFANSFYKANYNTTISSFENSSSQQLDLKNRITRYNSSTDFFTQFYYGLFKIDENKIKKLAKIFIDSATKKNLDATETAEMVVTFIQEIPYCLIHEGTCKEAIKTGNSFIVNYHQQHKVCLPNIVGGVQSPYEFLHNLKGDCDTRSLFAFSILKELNIASSVWVSEAYGHSILGVGVPVGYGIHKEINGINHYGVELTANGYRLGMVAPENNIPENWDITIFYNH